MFKTAAVSCSRSRRRSAGLTTVPISGETLRSGQQLAATATVSIGEIDTAHPALRGVDDLRSAKFNRYVGVEPGADDRVLIRLDDGTPLLIERTVGAGRVLLLHIVARSRVE